MTSGSLFSFGLQRTCLVMIGTAMLISTFGCEQSASTGKSTSVVQLFAAASTTDACQSAAAAFEQKSGTKVKLSTAGTNLLATQIIHGADADLFLSANEAWADEVEKQVGADRRLDFLKNRLVVIGPKDSEVNEIVLKDLAGDSISKIAIADPEGVPAGQYAKAACERAGLWKEIEPKLIATSDVRAVLAMVDRDEVDAGFVYRSDAAIDDNVRVICEVDEGTHPPIRYPLLLLKGAKENSAAVELFDFLTSPEGLAYFDEKGFAPAVPEEAPR